MILTRVVPAALLIACGASAQTTRDPFTSPIEATEDAIVVDFVELASIPDVNGEAARMMLLVDEPGTRRLFVNDMRGPLYAVSYDGQTVTEYVNIDGPRWGIGVQSSGRERGFQSFAFHPQFGEAGAAGFGKFYTWTDTDNTEPAPDFAAGGDGVSHHTVLQEWTARTPGAATYDGDPPRELARQETRSREGSAPGAPTFASAPAPTASSSCSTSTTAAFGCSCRRAAGRYNPAARLHQRNVPVSIGMFLARKNASTSAKSVRSTRSAFIAEASVPSMTTHR